MVDLQQIENGDCPDNYNLPSCFASEGLYLKNSLMIPEGDLKCLYRLKRGQKITSGFVVFLLIGVLGPLHGMPYPHIFS